MTQAPDAVYCLADGVVVQTALAQHWMGHDRARVAVFQHQDRHALRVRVLGEEAVVHRDLWD
eukprot:991759-Alexandrium_andersonii.AAC.1